MGEQKILIISEGLEEDGLLDRFAPIVKEIKSHKREASVTGIFYFNDHTAEIGDNRAGYKEIYLPKRPMELFSCLKKHNDADIVYAFFSHAPALSHYPNFNDIYIYLALRLSKLRNVKYLRRNLLILRESLNNNTDEREIVRDLIPDEIIQMLTLHVKSRLFTLLLRIYAFYRRVTSRKKVDNDRHKILVLRHDLLGDMIVTYPFIKALRRRYPDSEITVLSSVAGGVFLTQWQKVEDIPVMDRHIIWDAPWHVKRFNAPIASDLYEIFKAIEQFRTERFDLVIQCEGYRGMSLVLPAAIDSVKCIAMVADTILARSLGRFIETPIHRPRYKTLSIKGSLDMIFGKAGVRKGEVEHHIDLPMDIKRDIETKYLKGLARPFMIINIGGSQGVKRWSVDKYRELIESLTEETDGEVVILGGSGETGLASEIMKGCTKPVIDMTGRLNLSEAAALIALCRVIITSDSGIMHLAAMIDAQIVAMFGPSSVRYSRPDTNDHIIVRHELSCFGCGDRCFVDKVIAPCMDSIEVDEVLNSVLTLI